MSRRFIISLSVLGVLLILSLFAANFGYVKLQDLQTLDAEAVRIAKAYPQAYQMPTSRLAQVLVREGHTVLLVDAREPEEYAVSHLPGAELAHTLGEVQSLVEAHAANEVVVYDTVGHRASELVLKLRGEVPVPVSSLRGGIVAWANEGRPIVTAEDQPASKVHQFEAKWGRLLNEDLREPLPEEEEEAESTAP